LLTVAGRGDERTLNLRRSVDKIIAELDTKEGPVARAVQLCLKVRGFEDTTWEKDLESLKEALNILEAASAKFSAAVLCERIADLLHKRGHPKLAHRFMLHAGVLARSLSNDLLAKRIEAKADEQAKLVYEKSALLESIDGISKIVENLDSYTDALDSIVRFAVGATEAERGVLMTRENPDSVLRVRTYINFDLKTLKDVEDFSRSIAASALNEGEALIVSDALSDSRTRGVKSIYAHNIRSVICVPIRSDRHVDAVIYLDHHTIPALFDEDDVKFIQALSRFLSVVLRSARRRKSDEARREYLEEKMAEGGRGDVFITRDENTLSLLEKIPQIAQSRAGVLIRGESGTGKEILANTLHTLSGRADNPMVTVNCSAIAGSLVESELFGVAKGTATGVDAREGKFETADGGTLLLDEIGELPLDVQPKVLRAIEYQKFERVGSNKTIQTDVRFLYATNRDLQEMVKRGEFRSDLYHRIVTIDIEIPPLRDRVDDIQPLLDHFAALFARDKKRPVEFTDRALTLLEAYAWPGNVRELRNVVEQMSILYPSREIGVRQLPSTLVTAAKAEGNTRGTEQAEARRMKKALSRSDGNQAEAARVLGIPLTTFRRKLKKYGLR
jgi:Nif-specific regulatory protein